MNNLNNSNKELLNSQIIKITFVLLICFCYLSLKQNSLFIGFLISLIFFLFVCVCQFRNGPFQRPSPMVWRVVLGCSVYYQMILIILLFQNKHFIRQSLQLLDSNLNKKLIEISHTQDCSLTLSTLRNQLDIFVIAHTLGWIAKALIFRDMW